MKIKHITEGQVNEISANPDYLRAAERSLSQARATQRTFGKSPEEKARAERTIKNRERGMMGYGKRHRAAHPEMYPKVEPRPAPKLRDPSTEYSDDYSVWAKGRRDTMEQGVAEDKGMSGYNKFKQEWRAKHGDKKPVPGYDSKEYTQHIYQQNDKKKGVAEGDISQLEKDIADAPVEPIANMEGKDEKIGGRHDPDDFDAMVGRLKKLAGSGPMKTVYDPNTRRYKNMPTAVQPPVQPKK